MILPPHSLFYYKFKSQLKCTTLKWGNKILCKEVYDNMWLSHIIIKFISKCSFRPDRNKVSYKLSAIS